MRNLQGDFRLQGQVNSGVYVISLSKTNTLELISFSMTISVCLCLLLQLVDNE